MEQTLGHVTYCQNLARTVAIRKDIDPAWMPVSSESNDLWNRVPGVRGNWTLKGSLRARSLLKQHSNSGFGALDALFIHTQTVALFALPWMRHIPTIISLDATPRNIDSLGAGYAHRTAGVVVESVKRICTRGVFRAASRLVCWSKWAAESLMADYSIHPELIKVVPPGVDIRYWRPPVGVHDWDGKRAIRLLFVGGDFTRKGGPDLLHAFAEYLQKGFTLDIVTQDRISVGNECKHGVTVHYNLPANGNALRDLYHTADIFVLPTLADCLPIALLEAMAAGLPCVTTRVGAIPEAVTQNRNGLLVDPRSPLELAAAIREVSSTPRRLAELSAESLRIATDKYDAERNYGAVLAIMTMLSQLTRRRE